MTKEWKENLRRLVFPDYERLYLDMQGREMKIAANDYAGFFSIDQVTQQLLGIDGAIVETLSRAMNFTYKIVRPPDGYWGNPLPDGTVSGVIGMAARWEVAFSICSITQTELRDTVVDFTVPYVIEPLALFSRAPQEKNRVLAILAPFKLEVWVSLIAATLAIGPLLSLQRVVSDTILKKRTRVGLQEFSFNMFRTLTIQGNRLRSHLWSQRLLFFSWYSFCLLFAAVYSGMLTAVLSIPAFEKPIDSLLDLPKAVRDGYTLSVLKDTAVEMLFREAKSGIYRETWLLFNHKNPEESFMQRPEVGIERAMNRKYVFIGFKTSYEIMVFQIGRRKFHIGRGTFYPMINAIALPPGAPYKRAFDRMLLLITEGGLIVKWRADEFTKVSFTAASDTGASSRKTYAINLIHLQAAFIVFLLGLFIATITLTVENIFRKNRSE
ncbi:glutamate receptor ionotropic, delta-1-like [Palaemon carinicauda]|uniref:glutamate receptor ionotropic, delta-1-like n=1 Tax=Palaemon carinicauda TaxID=392227 RepID=UPI0035B6015C